MKKIDVLEMRNVEAGSPWKFSDNSEYVVLNFGLLNVTLRTNRFMMFVLDKIQFGWEEYDDENGDHGDDLSSLVGGQYFRWNPWKLFTSFTGWVFGNK